MAGFLPAKDADLLAWGNQFSTVVGVSSVPFGLTAAMMTSFNAALDAFSTSLALCEPGIRNKSATATKNSCRLTLRRDAGFLSRVVQGQANVTDAQKLQLGLNVKAEPLPQPPPADAPACDLVSVVQNKAKFRAHDAATPSKRGRAKGAKLLSVFSHIGATVPPDVSGWVWNGTTRSATVEVAFDPTLPLGTKAFICACWVGSSGATSPACTPVEITLLGGGALPSNVEMKLAA